MKQRFLHLLNLRPGEWKLVLSMLVLLAVNIMVLELSDVVATAGFISNVGSAQVPWLWIADMIVTLFTAGGFIMIVDRMPRVRLISWILGGLALVYLILQLLFSYGAPDWLTYPTLYILADQQFMLFPLAFWALGNDVYTLSESKRLFPVIGVGAALGSIIGNALAALSAVLLTRTGGNVTSLFSVAAVVLLVGLALLQLTFRKQDIRARQSQENFNFRETIATGVDFFKNVPLYFYLAISMLLMGLSLTIIEYHFLATVERSFSTDLQFQTFYGIYKTVLIVSLLLLQGLVVGRLLQKVPLKNAFIFLPITLLLAGLWVLFFPILIGAASGRFLARLVERAWDEPTRKSAQNLVPDERRGRISTFVDNYFFTIATILGSVLLLILLGSIEMGWLAAEVAISIYLGIAVVAAAIAIWASWRIRKVYDESLLNWRLSRSRRKSVLDGIEF